MRLQKHLKEVKWMGGTLVAFGVGNKQFRPLQDIIENILNDNGMVYDRLKGDSHISIAHISGEHPKDYIVRAMSSVHKSIRFRPKELTKLSGTAVKKDFIVIEYRANKEYNDIAKDFEDDFIVKMFPGGMRPHISLFSVEKNSISDNMMAEIVKATKGKIPKVRPKSVEMFNKYHEVEFSRRVK